MNKLLLSIVVTAVFCIIPQPITIDGFIKKEDIQGTEVEQQRRIVKENSNSTTDDAIKKCLYYRFGETRFLGCEEVQIDISREETIATLVVNELIKGPSASRQQLTGLFPVGTRLINARVEGTTAYITLSSEFLGMPEGAPLNWEENSQWVQEAKLRRRLAFQSIVLALTEGGQCQRVQLFIAEDDDSVPERVPLYLLDDEETDTNLRLAACGRDESVLINPTLVVEAVFHSWMKQDWEMAYPFIWAEDDMNSNALDFIMAMEQNSVSLLSYRMNNGTVSLDGKIATLVIDATLLDMNGERTNIVRESIPIYRIQDNWMMAYSTLLSLMIRD